MRAMFLPASFLLACSCATGSVMPTQKKAVELWYDAFDQHNPALLDQILSETWIESPSEPGVKPAGRDDVKTMLVRLTTTFPDFRIRVEDVIEEGSKVVVRSHITGTQAAEFRGFASKN